MKQRFGQLRPLLLDVGCGPGVFVVGLAQAHPGCNVLGLEIRQHLVSTGNAAIAALGLGNATVVLGNANTQLGELLGPASFKLVTINFPDPWFKLRHHKRRVLTASFAATLLGRMAPGGEVHFMTDVADLAATMRKTLTRAGFIDHFAPGSWPTTSTTGVVSEREVWHQSKGDQIWRSAFYAPPPQPLRSA